MFILQFFEKKGVSDMKTAEELFQSITGFAEVDVNMLEGVHTTFNSLTSRFEISLDDNRNTSYPFEYCWQKTLEGKKSDKSGNEDSDDDDFEGMWTHSIKSKVDTAADFGNEIKIPDPQKVDKKVNFANEIGITIPGKDGETSSSGIDKKS